VQELLGRQQGAFRGLKERVEGRLRLEGDLFDGERAVPDREAVGAEHLVDRRGEGVGSAADQQRRLSRDRPGERDRDRRQHDEAGGIRHDDDQETGPARSGLQGIDRRGERIRDDRPDHERQHHRPREPEQRGQRERQEDDAA